MSKIKVTGRQKPQEIAAYLANMFMGGESSAGAAQVPTAN